MAAVFALVISGAGVAVAVWAVFHARHAASAARDSAQQARNANANTLGPTLQLQVSRAQPERFRVTTEADVPHPDGLALPYKDNFRANPVEPGLELVMPRDGAFALSTQVALVVVNEGPRTATLRVGGALTGHLDPYGVTLPLRDGALGLAPGGRATLVLFPTLTLEEWTELGRPSEPVVREIAAESWVEPDGSRQHWRLDVTATYFDPLHGNDSGARVVPSSPPEACLQVLSRTYP